MTELDKVYAKYKNTVNMTYSEMLRWSKNPCSYKASLDRSPIQRNLRLLRKSKSQWTNQDMADAKKTIAFVARMKKVKAGKKIEGCGMSKRTISLLNWSYDPRK
jgi:hypothetical protein